MAFEKFMQNQEILLQTYLSQTLQSFRIGLFLGYMYLFVRFIATQKEMYDTSSEYFFLIWVYIRNFVMLLVCLNLSL